MLAIVSALAASACWGVADFFGGLMSRRISSLTVTLSVEAAGLLIVAAIMAVVQPPMPSATQAVWAVGGGLSGVVGLGAFYRALAIGTMSIVAPISSTGVALPVLVGLAEGNRISAAQAFGLGFAVVGVILAGRETEEDRDAGADTRRAVALALAAAVGFGGYFIAADQAADGGVLWTLLLGRAAAVPVLAAIALAVGTALTPSAPQALRLLGVGAMDLTATGLYAFATTKGLLAVVAVLGALYPVTTVLLARGILGERLTRVQDAGVAAALAGVALIAAG